MHKLLMFGCLAALVTLSVGCQSGSEVKTSSQGFEYTLHTAGNDAPEIGEYVYFNAYMRNGDSLVYSSLEQGGQTPFMQITEVPPGSPPNPFLDVLREIGVGDSVSIAYRIDTLPQKPLGFENAEFIYYDLAVTEIVSQQDFEARRQEQQEEMQRKAGEIQARAPEAMAAAKKAIEDYKNNAYGDQLKTTDSGLKYIILEEGTGAQAESGKYVDVNYIGMLTDGQVFDQSFERGQAFSFPLGAGQVIPGWDEGIALLKEGGKAVLFVPSELGYGATGAGEQIPPNSELVFYVELDKIN